MALDEKRLAAVEKWKLEHPKLNGDDWNFEAQPDGTLIAKPGLIANEQEGSPNQAPRPKP